MNHPRETTTTPPTERDGRVGLAERVRSLQLPAGSSGRRSGLWLWLPWLLVAMLAGFVAFQKLATGKFTPEDAKKVKPDTEETPDDGVVLEAGGFVVPVRTIRVSPQVPGRVETVYFNQYKEGQFFRKGELLAVLDDREYRFELDRAIAAHQEAEALEAQALAKYEEMQAGSREQEKLQSKALVAEAEEILRQLKTEEERLVKAGTSTSPDDLDKIKSRRRQAELRLEQLKEQDKMVQEGNRREKIDSAKHEYEAARARTAKAKADREFAQKRFDDTRVRAPVNGTILTRKAEEGDTVSPQAFSSDLSTIVCLMANLRELEVEVDVSERDLKRIFTGQKCIIVTEAYPGLTYDGRIDRIMPLAIRSKASVTVRVAVHLPDYSWTMALPIFGHAGIGQGQSALVDAAILGDWTVGKTYLPDPFLRPEMRARVRFLSPAKSSSTGESKPPAAGTP